MSTEHSFGGMDRRKFLKLGGAGLAGAVLLGTAGAMGSRVLAREASSLIAEFESAATEYGVPQDLLLAMGYVNTMWEMRMYRSSARLSAYLSRRYNIPVDRRHFIGHRQVPGVDQTCPGSYFNWDRYLRLVRRYRKRAARE